MNKKLLSFLFLLTFVFHSFSQETVTYQDAFPNLSFQFPVEIQNASDDSNRMFVVEQQGIIKVFNNDESTTKADIFLDIQDIVSFSSGQEIGLLGLAFHPNYKTNGTFFVYHTKASTVANVGVEIVLAKYTVDAANRNRANKNSRVEVFSFDKNQNTSNHNGGKIGFGPDGYLYASLGDGGGGGDPMRNAQNLDNVFGSILRIDVDLDGSNPLESNPDLPNGNYEIPRDNPRVGRSGLDELYAWGIRNTWKFSFDNDIMWGADVGQDRVEEINHIVKGGNFGWNRIEGNATYNSSTALITNPDVKPVFEYGHTNGDLSITGGYVYNGISNNTLLKGKYIYADYVSGRVWSLNYNNVNKSATSTLLFRTSGEYVSSFGLDESGELYFSGYGTAAKLYKISGGQETVVPEPIQSNGIGFWEEIANGTNGVINCLLEDGDNIYIGGLFSRAGNATANNFAVYNKVTGWKTSLGSVNGEVKTIAATTSKQLVIGGSFSQVNGVNANNIAILNGTSWSALGSGTNGAVAKIAIDNNNKIYVGGAFTNANGILVNNIAVFNNSWQALKEQTSNQLGVNNEVREIEISDTGIVYVGGNFDTAGGKSAPRIATWNGTTWGTLGEGTSGFVEAIALKDNYIYVGGNFNLASGQTVNRIARWNKASSQWEKLGNGLSGSVNTIAIDNDNVYVGGNFAFASNEVSKSVIVNNLARWSSAEGWQPLGEKLQVGSNNIVNAINLTGDNKTLFVAGNFTSVGDLNSNYIAQWSEKFNCSNNRIIQEYQINGTWTSGKSAIEVNEGDKVVLSILPNGEQFSIKLPNGTVVNGDYSLGEIDKGQEGIYEFKTQDGCTATLEITVMTETDCTATILTPQYQIDNGGWEFFINDTLIVGEESLLSLRLSDYTDTYSIESPSGAINSGPLVLQNATVGNYTFSSTEGCSKTIVLQGCTTTTVIPEFKIGEGDWIKGETSLIVDEGSSIVLGLSNLENTNYTIVGPNQVVNIGTLNLEEITQEDAGVYIFKNATGCTETFELKVISFSSGTCPTEIANENQLLNLPNGEYDTLLLNVEGVDDDTNNSACAMKITSFGYGGLWHRYKLALNLNDLGLKAGDELNFSVDAKSINGNARIEVVENNTPNTWKIGHTFTKEWTTYSKIITVPNNISSLDIWLFSNYGKMEAGSVLYDNLIVEKIIDEEELECQDSFPSQDITFKESIFQAGLDTIEGFDSGIAGIDCAIELSNLDQNQPWSRYSIPINMLENGIKSGDVLTISLDGKTVTGNARIEVVYNDKPNSWDLGHSFTNEWSSYSKNITIPLNTKTLDIWLFTNHNKTSSKGIAQFANLRVEKGSGQQITALKYNYGDTEKEFLETDIIIFPNPTADMVSVDVSKFKNQALILTVVSSNNSAVMMQNLDRGHDDLISLDFSQYPEGVYILTLSLDNGESFVKKIIKK